MKRYVKIELVDIPGFCPARAISKEGRGYCRYTMRENDCPSWDTFPDSCPLSEAYDI